MGQPAIGFLGRRQEYPTAPLEQVRSVCRLQGDGGCAGAEEESLVFAWTNQSFAFPWSRGEWPRSISRVVER